MAEKGKRRLHTFASGHSIAWLRGSLKVTARRAGNDHVRVAIQSWAGHAFPTGDLFRRLTLTAEALTPAPELDVQPGHRLDLRAGGALGKAAGQEREHGRRRV